MLHTFSISPMSPLDQPHYEHDCGACVFLGGLAQTAEDMEAHGGPERVDLYLCPRPGAYGKGTFLVRFGSEGGEYLSLPRPRDDRDLARFHDPVMDCRPHPSVMEAVRRGLAITPGEGCPTSDAPPPAWR